jgi:hypothetical protein
MKSRPRSLLFGTLNEAQALEIMTRQRYQLYLVLEGEEKRGIYTGYQDVRFRKGALAVLNVSTVFRWKLSFC